MSYTHESTKRIYLGTATLQAAAPAGVPAAGSGVVANLYTLTIGPGLSTAEIRRMRFNLCEAVVTFNGDRTSCDIIPYYSRVNPAPNDYATETDNADSWHSAGGQAVQKTAVAGIGDTIEVAPRGASLVYFQYANLDGSSGSVTVDLYGLMSGPGGGW